MKSDHQEDVRRRACNVGDETGFAPSVQRNNETSNFVTEFAVLDQGVTPRYKMKSRLTKVECLLLFPIPKNVQSNSVLKLVGARNVLPHGRVKRAFAFLQIVKIDAFDDERFKLFVCAGLFGETIPFCVSVDGSEFNPINTSSISGILRCPFVVHDSSQLANRASRTSATDFFRGS